MPLDTTNVELRQIRHTLGWTQGQLATHLGCHWVAISRYENGHRRVPEAVIRLARRLLSEHSRPQGKAPGA